MDTVIHAIYDFNEQIIGMPNDLPLQPLSKELKEWFMSALREEQEEYHMAWLSADMVGQVDAIIDTIYFAVGRLQQMGLSRAQAIECFNAVHQANMTKKRGAQAKRGNIETDAVKPIDWISPEEGIERILFGSK